MLSKLNYEIVCEGVETKDTLSVIGRITNDVVIQGYYFSKPIPIHQFESFLNTNYDDLIAEIVVEESLVVFIPFSGGSKILSPHRTGQVQDKDDI